MKIKNLILTFCLCLPVVASAQRTDKVSATYTYTATKTMPVSQAEQIALERAKIQAIAEKYGTLVSQSNTTYVRNNDGKSTIDFNSVSSSDVKGEWIETIGEPEFSNPIFEKDIYSVTVTVKGTIREIVSSQVDLDYAVLCNGFESRNERTQFKNGDDMYLRFQSPVDGFLAVYLVDHNAGSVYCLLPYARSGMASQTIEHDKKYIFFSSQYAEDEVKNKVDEYNLTTSVEQERDDIVVLFSPNKFTKANSEQTDEMLPRELSLKAFDTWLGSVKRKDKDFVEKRIVLEIRK